MWTELMMSSDERTDRWHHKEISGTEPFIKGQLIDNIYVYECDSCSKNTVNIHKLILNNTFYTLRNCAVKYKTSFTIKSKFQKNKYSPLSVFCFDLNFFGFKGILPPDTL